MRLITIDQPLGALLDEKTLESPLGKLRAEIQHPPRQGLDVQIWLDDAWSLTHLNHASVCMQKAWTVDPVEELFSLPYHTPNRCSRLGRLRRQVGSPEELDNHAHQAELLIRRLLVALARKKSASLSPQGNMGGACCS